MKVRNASVIMIDCVRNLLMTALIIGHHFNNMVLGYTVVRIGKKSQNNVLSSAYSIL